MLQQLHGHGAGGYYSQKGGGGGGGGYYSQGGGGMAPGSCASSRRSLIFFGKEVATTPREETVEAVVATTRKVVEEVLSQTLRQIRQHLFQSPLQVVSMLKAAVVVGQLSFSSCQLPSDKSSKDKARRWLLRAGKRRRRRTPLDLFEKKMVLLCCFRASQEATTVAKVVEAMGSTVNCVSVRPGGFLPSPCVL